MWGGGKGCVKNYVAPCIGALAHQSNEIPDKAGFRCFQRGTVQWGLSFSFFQLVHFPRDAEGAFEIAMLVRNRIPTSPSKNRETIFFDFKCSPQLLL